MFKNSDMAAVKLGLDKIYKNLTQELTYESYKIALIGNLEKIQATNTLGTKTIHYFKDDRGEDLFKDTLNRKEVCQRIR